MDKLFIMLLAAGVVSAGHPKSAKAADKNANVMQLASPAFKQGGMIPAKYTCDGDNINPPLSIKNLPEAAQSLALVAEDPDAPGGTFVHWVAYDMPVSGAVDENTAPGIQGRNSGRTNGYTGPCPPSGRHRYIFTVYALDAKLGLKEGVDRDTVIAAMEGHVISRAQLTGVYERTKAAE